MPNINKAFANAKVINRTFDKSINYIDDIIHKRDDYPPSARQVIKRYGESPIKSISINRTPVNKILLGSLNVASLGDFNKNLANLPYDQLYHLDIVINVEPGTAVKVEKNEVINIDTRINHNNKTETKQLSFVPVGLTLNKLLEGGKKILGSKYFDYSAYNNNCQDYIMALLKGSNIGNEQDFNFIKQDTKSLFKNNPALRKFANTVTDIGARANVVIEGSGMNNHNIQSILFNKPAYTNSKAVKWLKKHKFSGLEVDEKPNHLRYRQQDPDKMTTQGYHFITKPIFKDISFIIGIKHNNNMFDDSDSDSYSSSDSDSDISDEDEKEIVKSMKQLGRRIKHHHKMKGGKITFAKHFNKIGKDVKDNLNMVDRTAVNLGNRAMNKVIKPTGKYITNTNGLLSDVVNYGIPAATGATFGAVGGLTGNPLIGVAASALGSKLGTMASDKIAKETMIQDRTGKGINKVKNTRKRLKGKGDLIHIDISSHNAKGKSATNKMFGGDIEMYNPVGHHGLNTNQPVPSFEQTKTRKRIVSDSALLNMVSDQDLKDVKQMLSSKTVEDSLTPTQRKAIARKMKKEFEDNVKKIKSNQSKKNKPTGKYDAPHHVKGSSEAKDHMAKLRAMRKTK